MAINLTNPMTGDAFKAEVENALDKRGDAMNEGATLSLGKDPENDMDSATKRYVDNNIIFANIKVENGTPPNTVVGTIDGVTQNKYIILELTDIQGSGNNVRLIETNTTYSIYGNSDYGSFIISPNGEIIITKTVTVYPEYIYLKILILPCAYSSI